MKVVFSEEEIESRIKEVVEEINSFYRDKDKVVVLYIEKGGRVFFEKLKKYLNFPYEEDSLRVKSYENTESTGELKWLKVPCVSFQGKYCLLVDDVLDTGQTTKEIRDYVIEKGAKDCRICVAVDKLERRREDIKPDYSLFKVDNGFLVGFGMDYNEKYRDLPYIGLLD